jgi:hypothetical protein
MTLPIGRDAALPAPILSCRETQRRLPAPRALLTFLVCCELGRPLPAGGCTSYRAAAPRGGTGPRLHIDNLLYCNWQQHNVWLLIQPKPLKQMELKAHRPWMGLFCYVLSRCLGTPPLWVSLFPPGSRG